MTVARGLDQRHRAEYSRRPRLSLMGNGAMFPEAERRGAETKAAERAGGGRRTRL